MKDILMAEVPLNFGKLPDPLTARRKWMVFFQRQDARWLLVTCMRTGAKGAIKDPSDEEWDLTENSWESALPWHDNARVTLIEEGRL